MLSLSVPAGRTKTADSKQTNRPRFLLHPGGAQSKPSTRHTVRGSMMVPDPPIKYRELQKELTASRQKINQLSVHLEMADKRFIEKCIFYQQEIKSLKQHLKMIRQSASPQKQLMNASIREVDQLYKDLMTAIEVFKSQTKQEMSIQEKGIIRAFDRKLFGICQNIQSKRQKKLDEVSDLVKNQKSISKELQVLRGSAYEIQKKNQILQEENKQLRSELENRELEFNTLMTKYFRLKRRKQGRDQIQKHFQTDTPKNYQQKVVQSFDRTQEYTQRYQNVIQKLRKQLAIERKNLRSARTAYSRELESKTGIQKLLRQCIDDIRADISRKKGMRRGETEEERKMIVDSLMQTQEVMRLLYDKAYPLSDGIGRPLGS